MTFPTIKIQFIGTTSTCCSNNAKNEFKVAYRADNDSFVAVAPTTSLRNKRAVFATLQALTDVLCERYQLQLSEIPVQLSHDDLPSLEEVRNIEEIARREHLIRSDPDPRNGTVGDSSVNEPYDS